MNHKIFTIYDSKANAYLTPFFLHEDGMAVRVFADCVNDNTHQFGKHPEDYTLFNIGSWSDDKAKFLTNNPISLGNGLEFVKQQELNFFGEEKTYPELGELRKGDQGYEAEITKLKGNKQ